MKVKTCKEYIYQNNKCVLRQENGENVWYKVEPIEWEISNWDATKVAKESKDINVKLEFVLRAKLSIVINVPFYPTVYEQYSDMWQNSTIRAYLNNMNVNYLTTNGNSKYSASCGGDFTQFGFLDEAFTNCGLTKIQTKQSKITPSIDVNKAMILTETRFKVQEENKI